MMGRRAALLLAAGFGTRMGALTRARPKALIEVAGRPLIDHAIVAAGQAEPMVVNGHYQAAMLRDHLAQHHPKILFSHEADRILDSGGAVKHALPLLGSPPVLTINADAVWTGPPAHEVLDQAWDPNRMTALLLMVPPARAVGRMQGGDFALGADKRLRWDRSPAGWIYTGAQIVDTRAIAKHREDVFSLLEIWEDAMQQGRLYGREYPGAWADVGHPQGIAAAEAMLDAPP